MVTGLWVWLEAKANLSFGQLANVQTVGIGLYLALGVLQAISATGVAGLGRRVNTLRTAAASARLRLEMTNIRRLSGDVSGLEIGFHKLNRRLLATVFALFSISVAYFGWCTIAQNTDARHLGLIFILFFYLMVPILIFIFIGALIWWRCRGVATRLNDAEKRIRDVLLQLV